MRISVTIYVNIPNTYLGIRGQQFCRLNRLDDLIKPN